MREDDEPLNDEAFVQLPGNLKKSYLMMEIQEDKLQQRILKLRKKQNNGGRNNSIGAYSNGGGDQS